MAKKKTRPPDTSSDPVGAYARRVISGEIVAGPLVRAACKRHERDIAEQEKRGLRWDAKAANYAIGFFRDVLAIVRSDDLVDRENRLAALFSHASLGIVRCNQRNQVLEANEAAAQMLGCHAQHLRGRLGVGVDVELGHRGGVAPVHAAAHHHDLAQQAGQLGGARHGQRHPPRPRRHPRLHRQQT